MRTENSEYPALIIKGEGSDIKNSKVLNSRAKKKLVTNVLTLKLVKHAEKKGDTEMAQSFRNTLHCLDEMIIENGKMHGKFCKNRFCLVCNSFRKASLINRYLPVVNKWSDPHFVLLTRQSVRAKYLEPTMDEMLKVFKKIINKYTKRHQRGMGTNLIGLRTFECNFNPIKGTYNPHFHIIVASKEIAEILRNEWINRWDSKLVDRKAQFYRKVTDTERDLIEVIKYCTKVFTMVKDKNYRVPTKIYIKAMYNVFKAFKKRRLIERFGFNFKSKQKKKKVENYIEDYTKVNYSLKDTDWVNEDTGKLLSNFYLDPELRDLLKNKIDTSLE